MRTIRLVTAAAAAVSLTTVLGQPVASRTAAAAAPTHQSAPARCDRTTTQDAGSSAKYELSSGGRTRSYILHLPRGYEKRSHWPLIVAYHGRGSTGTEIEGYSGLSNLPAVVAYPNGEIGTGSGYRQAFEGAPYAATGVDDVRFTSDLLDHLQAGYCVDPSRTYATGKSNGAGFVGLLACRLPERFAAFAPVAGAFYPKTRENCRTSSPTSVLDIHGTGDSTIPYTGDTDRGLPTIRSWVNAWATHDECASQPTVRRTGRDITTYRWAGCANGASVQHIAVTGGGHVWPGTNTYSGGGHVTHTISASRVIWRFFSEHRLTANPTTAKQEAHR